MLWLKWAAACLICAIFPFRNVEQSEDNLTVLVSLPQSLYTAVLKKLSRSVGGIAMVTAGVVYMRELRKRGQLPSLAPPLTQVRQRVVYL